MRALGIDIGGTSVKLALVDDGQTVWTGQSASYVRPNTETLIGALRGAAQGRVVEADVGGLCVPGLLDRSRRVITLAVNVPGLMNVPLDDLVGAALGGVGMGRAIGRVEIINDAVAAATDVVANRGLAGRVLAISLGTGVGAAVLDDGVPLYVEGGSPGHIGQLDVSVPGDPVIGPDGGAGSLEGYLGVPALLKRYRPGDPNELAEHMRADDAPLLALVHAVRLCHAIYRPHHVLLLGGIGIRLGPLLPALRVAIAQDLTSVARPDWSLSTGESDHHAALGAARLAAANDAR